MKKQSSPTQKMLSWWGGILIVWSIYRAIFKTDLPIWFDEFIAKPAVFILPVFIYIKKIEKKKFFESINLHLKNFSQDLLWALLFGLSFLLLGFYSNRFIFTSNIYLIVAIAFATSISEEILSRGFVLKRLYEDSKNILTSSFFASILFFFLRVPILFTNDKIVGDVLLTAMFIDIIFSLLVSIIFLLKRNLFLPILIHGFYSIYLYILFS